jgi:hypothetical protein
MKFEIGQRVNIVKITGDSEWVNRLRLMVGLNGTIKSVVGRGDFLYYQVVPDGYETSLIDFYEDELDAV